jgi:hypothetical protein
VNEAWRETVEELASYVSTTVQVDQALEYGR